MRRVVHKNPSHKRASRMELGGRWSLLRSPTQRRRYLCQFIYTILSYIYRHLAHTHTYNHARTSIALGHWTQRTIHKITPLYNEIYWSPNAMPRPCLMPTKMIYFDRKLICICSAIYANSIEHRYRTRAQFLWNTILVYLIKMYVHPFYTQSRFESHCSLLQRQYRECTVAHTNVSRTADNRNKYYINRKPCGKVERAMHKYNKNLQHKRKKCNIINDTRRSSTQNRFMDCTLHGISFEQIKFTSEPIA